MKHIVQFSAGVGSYMAAKRVVAQYGTADTLLLFADTLIEDADAYRFLDEAAANVGAELIKIAEGRDPWQVFNDRRFLGNSRVDPCSKVLKREVMRPIDLAILPDWARRDPLIVAQCRRSRQFYRDVILANSEPWQRALRELAMKRNGETTKDDDTADDE